MLNIGNHDGRRVEIELLDHIVRAQGEEARTRAVDGKASDVLECRNFVIGDMLRSNIP